MEFELKIRGNKDELERVIAALSDKSARAPTHAHTRARAYEKSSISIGDASSKKPRRAKNGKRIFTAHEGFGRAHRKWSRKENAYVRAAYKTTSVANMAKTLGRTEKSVLAHLWVMKLRPDAVLLPPVSHKEHQKASNALASAIVGIKTEKTKKSVKKWPAWSYAEDQQLRQLYGKVAAAGIAKRIGRSIKAVYIRAYTLRLSKAQTVPHKHDNDEVLHETSQDDATRQG